MSTLKKKTPIGITPLGPEVKNPQEVGRCSQEVECPTSNSPNGAVSSLGHHVHDGERWIKQQVEPHPMVNGLRVIVDKPGYKRFGFDELKEVHPIVVNGLADTGAQMTVISWALATRLRVKMNEMIPTSMVITAANSTKLEIVGRIPIKMIHYYGGKVRESCQLAYVARGVNQFFVCKLALCDLGLLPRGADHYKCA